MFFDFKLDFQKHSVNSFFRLPTFEWVELMRGLNLFGIAEIASLRFLGRFGSIFVTSWMLLDLMRAWEKAE